MGVVMGLWKEAIRAVFSPLSGGRERLTVLEETIIEGDNPVDLLLFNAFRN